MALRRDSHSCPQIFLDGSEDGLRIALDLALLDQVRRAATFPGISRANSLPEGDMASGQRDVPCGSKPEVAASIGYVRSTPKADFVVVMADVSLRAGFGLVHCNKNCGRSPTTDISAAFRRFA